MAVHEKHRQKRYVPILVQKRCRWIVLLLIWLLTAYHYTASAQSITLRAHNKPLLEILKKLQQQAKVDLFGDLNLLKQLSPFSIDVKKRDLSLVLQDLSKEQLFRLSLYRNAIIIQRVAVSQDKPVNDKIKPVDSEILIGEVIDESGHPLDGVTIRTTTEPFRSVVSEADGRFQLAINKAQSLLFTMVGYEPQTVQFIGQAPIRVRLQRRQEAIAEVLVSTGYGYRRPESMTGASRIITRRELEKFNNNSIFSVLQSLDPTFHLEQNIVVGSNPNVIPEVTMRGANNVGEYAINTPLIILDGFEVTLERLYDLDINRIETISLLKDASSTVLYGSRGGNGVMVIETRLPKNGALALTYALRTAVTAVDLSDYSLMNATEKLAYEKIAGVYTADPDKFSPEVANLEQARLDNLYNDRKANVLRGVNSYWLSQPVQSSLSFAHSLRAEGGTGRMRYSVEGNYNQLRGAMKGSGRWRGGAVADVVYRNQGKFMLRNNLSYLATKSSQSPYGTFARYAKMNPYQPLRNDQGALISGYFDEESAQVRYNPLFDATLPYRAEDRAHVLTNNLALEWYVFPSLLLRSTMVLEKNRNKSEYFISPVHSQFARAQVDSIGEYSLESGKGTDYAANLNLTYFKNSGKHAFSGSLIAEMKSSSFRQQTRSLAGFMDARTQDSIFKQQNRVLPGFPDAILWDSIADLAKINRSGERNVENRLLGLLFTGNYTYDQKYVLDLSYRVDGSSKFGENTRYGNFWSIGLGYNLHHEELFKRDWIQELRLFTNTGINGTDAFLANMTLSSYVLSPNQNYYKEFGLSYYNEGNPDLKWPQIRSWSLGTTGRLLNGKIQFSFAYYRKLTDRMIALVTVAPSVGLPNDSYFENMGKVQNRGFEFAATVKVFENQDKTFNWYLTASANRNQGKLLEISDALRQLNTTNLTKDADGLYRQTVYYEQGKSINNIKGVHSLGIDPASGREIFLDKYQHITTAWNADDITVIGNLEPKLFGQIHTAVNYKSFGVQAYFGYTLGGDIYNKTLANRIENVNPAFNTDIRVLNDRWRQPGDEKAFKDIRNLEMTNLTSRFVQRENTLRLSSLMVNYEFPPILIQKYRLQRLRLNFSANDLFRFSTIRMERGLDYPFARTFNLGFTAQF